MSRSITVKELIETKEDIVKVAKHLLGLLWPCEATRLIGLKVSNLHDKVEAEQMAAKKEEKISTEEESAKKQLACQEFSNRRGRKSEQVKKNQRRRTKKIRSEDCVKLDSFFEKKSLPI